MAPQDTELEFWPHAAPPRLVLVSDLDHTMVQNEDHRHTHLLRFNALWQSRLAHDCLLVYSTGRSPLLYRKLWGEAPLLTPGVLICSVGSEILYLRPPPAGQQAVEAGGMGESDGGGTAGWHYAPDTEWERLLDEGWDAQAAREAAARVPELTPQVASEQRRHKLSYHLHAADAVAGQAALARLREGLAAAGVRAKVVYSGGADVDVLAEGAGKGRALEHLMRRLRAAGRYPTLGVQVNGDSGNDIELFQVEGVRGCVVANAHPELRAFAQQHGAASPHVFQATLPCAGGILQAMASFGFLPTGPTSSLPAEAQARSAALSTIVAILGSPLPDDPRVTSGTAPEPAGDQPADGQAPADGEQTTGTGTAGPDPGLVSALGLDPEAAALLQGASARGVWADRLEVSLAAEAGAAGCEPPAFTVSCQVFTLEPTGERDLLAMSHCTLHVEAATGEEGEGAGGRGGGAQRGAGGEYVASMRSACMVGMGEVVLPPVASADSSSA